MGHSDIPENLIYGTFATLHMSSTLSYSKCHTSTEIEPFLNFTSNTSTNQGKPLKRGSNAPPQAEPGRFPGLWCLAGATIPYAPWCWYIHPHQWVILFEQNVGIHILAPLSIWDLWKMMTGRWLMDVHGIVFSHIVLRVLCTVNLKNGSCLSLGFPHDT